MGTRRKRVRLFIGCAIAAVLILALTTGREPRYARDPLSQWVLRLGIASGRIPAAMYFSPNGVQARTLSEMARMFRNEPSYTNAEIAIERMGPQAVPFLIKWADYHERPWRQRLASLCFKLPKKFAV